MNTENNKQFVTNHGLNVEVVENFYNPSEALFRKIMGLPFESLKVAVCGRKQTLKRKSCVFGDAGLYHKFYDTSVDWLLFPGTH